jgi:hypothetical protein
MSAKFKANYEMKLRRLFELSTNLNSFIDGHFSDEYVEWLEKCTKKSLFVRGFVVGAFVTAFGIYCWLFYNHP